MADRSDQQVEGIRKLNAAAAAGVLVALPVIPLALLNAPVAVSFVYLVLVVLVLGAVVLRERGRARETRQREV